MDGDRLCGRKRRQLPAPRFVTDPVWDCPDKSRRFSTRHSDAPDVPVERPRRESLLLLLYLVFYAFVLFGPVSGLLREAFKSERGESIAMLLFKLIVHVAIPVLLLRTIGARNPRRSGPGNQPPWCVGDIGLAQYADDRRRGPAQLDLRAANREGTDPSYHCRMGGVRVVLDGPRGRALRGVPLQRPSAVSAHSLDRFRPGGDRRDVSDLRVGARASTVSPWRRGCGSASIKPSQIMALTVGAIAPISILFGTLWYRTRSLVLVVLVHGATDALPAIERMLRIWT